MTTLNPDKIGLAVKCLICHQMKKPRGRSGPLAASFCEPIFPGLPGGCEGWDAEPRVGDLWPGESEADFGYPCTNHGTTLAAPGAS